MSACTLALQCSSQYQNEVDLCEKWWMSRTVSMTLSRTYIGEEVDNATLFKKNYITP